VDDLVLDIRYNGGGYLDIASELAYMIAGPARTSGSTFEQLQFNDKHPITNPVTGQSITPTPFLDRSQGFSNTFAANQQLPSLNLTRVYVLTGSNTCSASESIINGLRGVDVEVIQIGATTCGKPYGFYPTDNCGTTYFSIQFRGVNAKNFGDYTDGFVPSSTGNTGAQVKGCSVADDFTKELGDPAENRLESALGHQATGTCFALASEPDEFGMKPLSATEGVTPKPVWRTNRILRN
jgi:carboxyl-terminal processing protease